MVSKEKLKKDLKKLNQDLEKEINKKGILSEDTILNGNIGGEVNSMINSEEFFLISQSLKDIRAEMSLMRKHLIADSQNFMEDNLSKFKLELKKELQIFYNSSIQIFKSFDPRILKELLDGFQEITSKQEELKEKLNDFVSETKEDLLNLEKENSNSKLFYENKIEELQRIMEVGFKQEDQKIDRIRDEIKNLNNIRSRDLKSIERNYIKLVKTISQNHSKELLKLKNNLKKDNNLVENVQQRNREEIILPEEIDNKIFNEEKFIDVSRSEKILNIDEKIKKLSSLK